MALTDHMNEAGNTGIPQNETESTQAVPIEAPDFEAATKSTEEAFSSKILGKYDDVLIKKSRPPKGKGDGALRLYGVHTIDGDQKEEPIAWEDMASEYGKSFRQPKSGEPRPRDLIRAPGYFIGETNKIDNAESETTQEHALRINVSPAVSRIMSRSSDEAPQSTTSAPDRTRDEDHSTQLLEDIETTRQAWLAAEAESARHTGRTAKKHRDELWKKYNATVSAWITDEVRILGGSSEDVIKRLVHHEEWVSAHRLGQMMQVAGGYYALTEQEGSKADGVINGLAVYERQFTNPAGKFERLARWYGDKSGTKKERTARFAGKAVLTVGVGVLAGIGATVATPVIGLAAPAAAVVAGVKVGRASLLAKVNAKANDIYITPRATATAEKLVSKIEYMDGQRGLQQRRFRANKVESRSMAELIGKQTKANIWHNRLRVGAMAVTASGAALIPMYGGNLVDLAKDHNPIGFLKEHNPLRGFNFGWHIGNIHAGGNGTPSQESTKDPQQQGGGGNGQGQGQGNGDGGGQGHEGKSKHKDWELEKGETIWGDTTEFASANGVELTDAQTQKIVGRILAQNDLTWEEARSLPIGYDYHVNHNVIRMMIEEEAEKDAA